MRGGRKAERCSAGKQHKAQFDILRGSVSQFLISWSCVYHLAKGTFASLCPCVTTGHCWQNSVGSSICCLSLRGSVAWQWRTLQGAVTTWRIAGRPVHLLGNTPLSEICKVFALDQIAFFFFSFLFILKGKQMKG